MNDFWEFDSSIPVWACSQYGNYEHDWLNCFECIENYEKFLESD